MSAAPALTKKAQNALRKQVRVDLESRQLTKRLRDIWRRQRDRADDCKRPMEYGIDEFVAWVTSKIGWPCPYCLKKLSKANFNVDHKLPVSRGGLFELSNLLICCTACNRQKGIMDAGEFLSFLDLLGTFPAEVQKDIKGRLAIGARWSK